jgi:hypothetical protein
MGDRSAAEEHPAVQEARADSARKIVPLQQEFDKLGSQLERLQEILGDFRP